MLLKLLGVVVGTVAAGVYGDESDAVAGACDIGELTGFLALHRGEVGDDGLVGVHEVINASEVLRLGPRCGDRLAVCGVEVFAVLIADVVVAVYEIDLQSGDVLLKLLEIIGKRLVAFLLAVLCKVAGDEENVGLILADKVEHIVADTGAFGQQLSVTVECGGEVFGVRYHRR